MNGEADRPATLCLAGDVMVGRGIDQILAHPSDPRIQEGYVKDARDYVALAEGVNGPIEAPVAWAYVWGDALPFLRPADACIVNLETSITISDRYWRGKGIHYRMHPDNAECLRVAGVDCCVLANNHVLDWGYRGLEETLSTLEHAGIRTVGAGRNLEVARAPAVLPLPNGRRVLMFAYGATSSGVPPEWAAADARAGVNLLEDLTDETVERISAAVATARRPTDVVIVSLHWGPNWGYSVPDLRSRFARALIESGVDIVHGHSSHHPIGVERYRHGLILYGCGDLLNDYEGIPGHESLRGDLTLLYRVAIPRDPDAEWPLRMTPFQIRRMRLNHAARKDVEWLAAAVTRASARFGTRVRVAENNELVA